MIKLQSVAIDLLWTRYRGELARSMLVYYRIPDLMAKIRRSVSRVWIKGLGRGSCYVRWKCQATGADLRGVCGVEHPIEGSM